MTYQPTPIDTSGVELGDELDELVERLAENNHEVWAEERIAKGWSHGPERDDHSRQNPCLVPFADLPEEEKEVDRKNARETLKVILLAGFRIEKT